MVAGAIELDELCWTLLGWTGSRRIGGDKADLDTRRRIKRYIAREIYPLLRDAITPRPQSVQRAA